MGGFVWQRAMAAKHPNECPKRKDCFPISVLLLLPMCYAFLGQEDFHPHEKSQRKRSEVLLSLRIHGSGVLKHYAIDHY
jgi:hypothetical protein